MGPSPIQGPTPIRDPSPIRLANTDRRPNSRGGHASQIHASRRHASHDPLSNRGAPLHSNQ